MRTIVLATATLLAIGAGAARAERASVKLQEQAWLLPSDAGHPAAALAGGRAIAGPPRFAPGGGHRPQSDAAARATQYAASALSWIRRS